MDKKTLLTIIATKGILSYEAVCFLFNGYQPGVSRSVSELEILNYISEILIPCGNNKRSKKQKAYEITKEGLEYLISKSKNSDWTAKIEICDERLKNRFDGEKKEEIARYLSLSNSAVFFEAVTGEIFLCFPTMTRYAENNTLEKIITKACHRSVEVITSKSYNMEYFNAHYVKRTVSGSTSSITGIDRGRYVGVLTTDSERYAVYCPTKYNYNYNHPYLFETEHEVVDHYLACVDPARRREHIKAMFIIPNESAIISFFQNIDFEDPKKIFGKGFDDIIVLPMSSDGVNVCERIFKYGLKEFMKYTHDYLIENYALNNDSFPGISPDLISLKDRYDCPVFNGTAINIKQIREIKKFLRLGNLRNLKVYCLERHENIYRSIFPEIKPDNIIPFK